jgi:hypothetical protein
MERPELIFVTGCNAAGKSSLIRTHLSLFPDFEVIMTDVYKVRSHEVFKEAVFERKSIILEPLLIMKALRISLIFQGIRGINLL